MCAMMPMFRVRSSGKAAGPAFLAMVLPVEEDRAALSLRRAFPESERILPPVPHGAFDRGVPRQDAPTGRGGPRLAGEHRKERIMLGWALTFLLIALVAAVFGFGGIAGTAAGIAKVLFAIFLILFFVSLIANVGSRRGPVAPPPV